MDDRMVAMGMSAAFLGRERECREVSELMDANALITLVGPGGIGKTRLATEISTDSQNRFDGGVLVSELAGLSDDDNISSVVARQLGCDSLDALRYRSVGSRTLVVLDNCESALVQASEVASFLVEEELGISVLATSRAPLQVYGERVVAIDPLAIPDSGDLDVVRAAAAVRLFVDRAERAGARWELNDRNLEAIGRLVRRLDGLPLAIELAAGRSRMLSPPELVDHLDKQLDLLTRPDGGSDRHQSLRTAIRTSYDPLPQRPQRLFRHLAVMSAPFDLDLAHAVGGTSDTTFDTLDQLTQLVNASLVDVRQNNEGVTRYRLLDSIRAFGLEQLELAGEADELGERYVDAMVDFADAIVVAALESFSPEVMGSIRDRFVHLANAITWCVANDDSADRAYRLFVPMYGPTGARTEVAALAREVLGAWSEPAPLQAEAFAVMGISTLLSGDAENGGALAQRAIDHPDATSLARMVAHRALGMIAAQERDSEGAKGHLEAAIDLAVPFSGSFARELQISWSASVFDPAESPAVLKRLAAVAQESADEDETLNVFWSSVVAAYHHVLVGDVPAARRSADVAMATAHRTGFPWSVGAGHRMMAQVLVRDEGWAAAAPHYLAAVDHTLGVGDIEGVAVTLRSAAAAARFVGDRELAAALWATVPALRARPLIQNMYHDSEQELLAEFGPPVPIPVATLVVSARQLLGGSPGGDGARGASPGRPSEDSRPIGDVIRFGDYELDLAMCELRLAGARIHIEPQVYAVLVHLVDQRGSVVSKNELLDEVWGNRFVSESALTSRIKAARRAIGDNGTDQRLIRTVHGRGYTFVAEVDTP